jgi:hypothetical protein
MNRGYFVKDKDEPWGIPVVATFASEARSELAGRTGGSTC